MDFLLGSRQTAHNMLLPQHHHSRQLLVVELWHSAFKKPFSILNAPKQSLKLLISFFKINLTSRFNKLFAVLVWDLKRIFFDSWIWGSPALGLNGALQICLDGPESGAFVLAESYWVNYFRTYFVAACSWETKIWLGFQYSDEASQSWYLVMRR